MEEVSFEKIARECMAAVQKQYRELKNLNIIVVGKTGVGKSTLINTIFRDNFAKTGTGRPVTTEVRMYTKENYPLRIYDTPGFELGGAQEQNVKDAVITLIQNGIQSKKIEEMIHCIWYCINVGSNRTFDDSEIEWIRSLTEDPRIDVPVLVILTQAVPKTKAETMKKDVERLNMNVSKVLTVLAQDMDFDGEYTAKAYGLEELVKVMAEILPNELKDTFQNVQIASLEEKKKQSRVAVATAVTAAATAGAVPIPFSDAALLIPIEVTMIASITVIFGMEVDKGFLTAFISSVLGTGGATVLGRTVVTNLLKLIPGANLAAGAISGATAGTLTAALGEAYINVMEWMFRNGKNADYLKSPEGQRRMKEDFERLKKNGV